MMSKTDVKNLFDLTDKIAIISGGAGFLGSIFAEALSELGAKVILLDISAKSLNFTKEVFRKKKINVETFNIDIRDKKKIRTVVNKIFKNFESIDILVNAAALAMQDMKNSKSSYFANFENYEKELWQNAIDVNLTGTFLLCQEVGFKMKKRQSGSIINIASDVGVISPDHRIYKPDLNKNYKGTNFNTPVSYSVTKTAIIGLTRYLATYWAEDGIRVNSISPAGVFRNQDPDFVEQLSYRIPLGRMAHAYELKGPLAFLASNASSFVTGENLMVDGGRTIW